jgi:GT2 family glycosyltransferase
MSVHILTPFRLDKNLGRAYNEAISLIPEGDWACLMDYDTLLLTPDAVNIIHGYAAAYPDAGIITCLTNRISPKNSHQLLTGAVMEESDIRRHIARAEEQKRFLYEAREVDKDISGFLMLIKKSTWNEHKFNDSGKCLGVDTEYNRRIRAAGLKILVAQGLYVFHIYRLMNGIQDKKHLH